MSANKNIKRRKGSYSNIRLPVTKKYIPPLSRNKMFLAGGVGVVIVLAIFLADKLLWGNRFISNGPLSSAHANFEKECANCHTEISFSRQKIARVSDNKCMVCHEKFGSDIKFHSFPAHYLYRSHDSRRVHVRDEIKREEQSCFSCHTEHLGREAAITKVPDTRCLSCHQYDSFNTHHPQFQFVRDSLTDNANLKFPHIFHVKEIRKQQEIDDIEQICLTCHTPQPDGENFAAIDFDRHCSSCHLGLENPKSTPDLAIKKTNNLPGALTPQKIREQRNPGFLWAISSNPNEFDVFHNTISKNILYHKDPWILANLKNTRREMFPSAGLADLLNADANVPLHSAKALYTEAIATLETYIHDLKSHPSESVQNNLKSFEQEIRQLKKIINDPGNLRLDYQKFALSAANMDKKFLQSPQRLKRYEAFVDELTVECQTCHYVENASIARVQKNQQYLLRAEFSHRAHILQRKCLDCHTQIPFTEWIDVKEKAPQEVDAAGIQNLPEIQECQSCHSAEAVSNSCFSCHQFHPNKSHQSNLLLYQN